MSRSPCTCIMGDTHLPVDGKSFPHSSLHLLERICCVPIKVVEVANPILTEERPRHGTMELPQFI